MAKTNKQTKGQAEVKLTAKDEQDIKDLFRKFAKNKKEITERDLKMGLRVYYSDNPTEDKFAQIYEDMNLKRGNPITFDVFRLMLVNYIQRTEGEQEQEMISAFKVFDKNGDGCIDKAELKNFMLNSGDALSEKELQDMFKLLDENKDGMIQYKEFVKLCCKKDEKRQRGK